MHTSLWPPLNAEERKCAGEIIREQQEIAHKEDPVEQQEFSKLN
jgi:hypothetical protein